MSKRDRIIAPPFYFAMSLHFTEVVYAWGVVGLDFQPLLYSFVFLSPHLTDKKFYCVDGMPKQCQKSSNT